MKRMLTILVVLLFAGMQILSAKSWRVSNADSTADFSSLDNAMAGIAAGDTLYLEGSHTQYFFSNPVSKKVTIIGPGYFLNNNPNTLVSKLTAFIAVNTIYLMAEGITLEGIYLDRSVYVGADNITVKRCKVGYLTFSGDNQTIVKNTAILQNYFSGRIVGMNLADNAIISNNIFEDAGSFINGCSNSLIENNTCVAGFSINGNADCTIKNNIVHAVNNNTDCAVSNNYEAKVADYITGTNLSDDSKWKLKDTSPGMTVGTNNSQVGAFGGSSPYILSGLPNVPHIYEIEAPTTASKNSGLEVVIKVGTEK